MASIIKIKRSTAEGSVPADGTLQAGELAINLFDRKIFSSSNGTDVLTLGGETADKLTTPRTIALSGDVVGSVLFDGSADVTISAAIQADSVALGADTTGDYVESLVAGSNLTITNNTGEGATPTIALNSTIATNLKGDIQSTNGTKVLENGTDGTDATFTGDVTGNLTGNVTGDLTGDVYASNGTSKILEAGTNGADATFTGDVTGDLTGNADTASALETARAIALSGDVTGTVNFDGSAGVTISTTISANSVALGTDTTGNYAGSVTGTSGEIEVTGAAGEGTTFQIGLPSDVTIGNDLTVTGAASVGGNLTVDGNLTVEGAVTYISSSTVNVDDSMLKLSANNAGDTVDSGVYGKYVDSGTNKYSGYYRDATDGSFKFYAGLEVEPTTTVDVTAAGYALAQLDAVIDGGTY